MKQSLVVGVPLLLAAATPASAADMWGCEVLLCLSNPAGPTAVAECKPPIHRLWRHLARGRSFPTCAMASTPETGNSYARLGNDHFEVCPKGTTMVESGRAPSYNEGGYDPGIPRLCGGTQVGWRTACQGGEGGCYSVPVYDSLTALSSYAFSGVIDVYISDALYQRVHWQDYAWGGGNEDPGRKGVAVAPGSCVGLSACVR